VRQVNSRYRARSTHVRRERHCAMSRRFVGPIPLRRAPFSAGSIPGGREVHRAVALVRQREVSDLERDGFLRPQSGVQAQDVIQPPGPTSWLVLRRLATTACASSSEATTISGLGCLFTCGRSRRLRWSATGSTSAVLRARRGLTHAWRASHSARGQCASGHLRFAFAACVDDLEHLRVEL